MSLEKEQAVVEVLFGMENDGPLKWHLVSLRDRSDGPWTRKVTATFRAWGPSRPMLTDGGAAGGYEKVIECTYEGSFTLEELGEAQIAAEAQAEGAGA